MSDIRVRTMFAGEEDAVCELVNRSFMQAVAPGYSGDGIAEFRKHAQPEAMAARCENGNIVLVAEKDFETVGMIEMREEKHICFFFVNPDEQRQGIGRALLDEALVLCGESREITVNSSPNSVAVYDRFGFLASGPEQEKNGIRFMPMTLKNPRASV